MNNLNSRQVLTLSSISQLANSPNTTFIIKTNLSYSGGSTILISPGVTLIFEGGQLLGNFTLQGNHTALEAPISQIFGAEVNVIGTWDIDRAYPQWFDNAVGTEKLNTELPHDCAPAINSVCKMITTGEVFFTAGYYFIGEPIVINAGIALVGVPSSRVDKEYQKINGWEDAIDDINFSSSIIVPFLKRKTMTGSTGLTAEVFYSPFVDMYYSSGVIPSVGGVIRYYPIIRINTSSNSQTNVESKTGATPPYTRLFNIRIANEWRATLGVSAASEETTLHSSPFANTYTSRDLPIYILSGCIGCMIGGGFHLENVHFSNFLCAVKCTDKSYNDLRSIVRCTFETNLEPSHRLLSKSFCYTLDLRGMGDGLLIEECAIHGNVTYERIENENENGDKETITYYRYPRVNGSIAIYDCKGGSINSCILNADALIDQCVAIQFFGNHMEYGSQLRILNSNLNITENYFEKGDRPSIAILPSANISDTAKHNHTYSIVNVANNNFVLIATNDERPTLGSYASEYDIQISQAVNSGISIHLQQNFRLPYYKLRTNQPSGIWLCDENGNAISEFNDYSYFLSRESTLVTGGRIIKHQAFTEIPKLSLNMMANQNVIKAEDVSDAPSDSTYLFTARVVIDKKRCIYGSQVSVSAPENNIPYMVKTTNNGIEETIETGMLIGCNWESSYRDCVVMMTRARVNAPISSRYSYVEVPVCAPFFMYDNSASVNGFKWKATQIISVNANTMIESVAFNGENVVCRASGIPTYGTWTVGDIIINTNPNSTGSTSGMWIYTKNGWIPNS